MDPFESLVSEFAGKAGLALQSGKDGSVDLVVDGVDVKLERYFGIASLERGEGANIIAPFVETARIWSDIVSRHIRQ